MLTSSQASKLTFLPSPVLRYLAIELTNNCNLKCSICWAQNPKLYPPRPKGYMTEELFNKILDDLECECHVRSMYIALSYAGESLLHPKFINYLKKLSTINPHRIQLATNGILLNKKIMNALLDAEAEIAVSLHKSKHLTKVLRKTKQFYHLKQQRQVNCSIRVNIVAEEWTQADIDMFIAKMHRDVDQIKLITYITEDMRTAMPHPTTWPLCPSHFSYLAVLWNGETYPCCHILSAPSDFSMGNVNETSIKNIFKGKAFERLRYTTQEDTPCETCQVRR